MLNLFNRLSWGATTTTITAASTRVIGAISGKTSSCQCGSNAKITHPNEMPNRLYGTIQVLTPTPAAVNLKTAPLTGSISGISTILESSGLVAGVYVPNRGMKWKGKVKRRCKDCFLMWIHGSLYNLCKAKPRHKHALKQPYFVNQRLLTHATTSPKRPW